MTICRPIILHNEFLPAKTGKREWEYRAFGHYDGITVQERINIEAYGDFKPLFHLYLQDEKENGIEKENVGFEYFSQPLFGFHEKTEDEENFWQNKLPFLYLVLLQVSDGQVEECRRYLESKEFLENELNRLKQSDRIKDTFIAAYYSLDNSDLIVAIKCGHADIGAALVNSLHRADRSGGAVRIMNSYSILGVCQSEIENPSAVVEENAPIDMMELRVVEGDGSLISVLYDILQNELEASKNGITICPRSLLGTEDGTIIVRNLPWRLLLPLYRETTGILNNSNKKAQDYAYAISSQIILPFEDQGKGNVKSVNERLDKMFCVCLKEKINVIYNKKRHAGWLAEKKNLVMFAKALFRFENAYYIRKEFSDYNFFALYLPFYTFVELLAEEGGDRPEDYYEFMKSLRLRTQSFAKPDRVFSQIADFNMRYFDIPTKIITLYSAYIHYFKQALNTEEKKNYEFLVCPGMNSQSGVNELFLRKSNKNRLFLIEIPEQEMYNLKQTFIVIGHEIAHFVGTEVRCRNERKEYMINLCTRIVVLSMKSYLGHYDPFVERRMDDLNFDNLETELCEWIRFYIEREMDDKYLRKFKYYPSVTDDMVRKDLEYKEQFKDHSDVLREMLIFAVREMLLEHGPDIFGYIFQKEFYENDERIGYENREDFLAARKQMLQVCINAFIDDSDPQNQSLIISKVMDHTIYLLKECYADMICILTLQLTLEDYLGVVAEIIDESNISLDVLMDTELPARVAIVMTVISQPLENKPDSEEFLFQWTEEQFNYRAAEESPIRMLENAANMFGFNYIQNETEIFPDDMFGRSNGIIYDQKFLREIIGYLLKCREKYYEMLISNKESNKKEEIRYVRDIYSLSRTQEGGDFFKGLERLLARYEADVYTEMQEMIRSEE